MHTYITTKQRYLVTDKDLTYAINGNGLVDMRRVKRADMLAINEAPDILTADILLYAAEALTTQETYDQHRSNLPEALMQTAKLAADAHAQCLAHPNETVYALAYPHMIATNKNRYAVSKKQLHSEDPLILEEEQLTEEDLKHTCIIADTRLALFLVKVSVGRFCDASEQIDATHHAECYIHNRITQHNDIVVCRDGTDTIPLQDLLKTAPRAELEVMLSAAEYQLAICTTYLAMVVAANG